MTSHQRTAKIGFHLNTLKASYSQRDAHTKNARKFVQLNEKKKLISGIIQDRKQTFAPHWKYLKKNKSLKEKVQSRTKFSEHVPNCIAAPSEGSIANFESLY